MVPTMMTTASSTASRTTTTMATSRFRQKRNDVDCGTKVCYLTHVMLTNCFVYLHTNNTECDIPCNLKGCERELHHFINCPFWQCHDIPTTTISTTTPKTTTTTNPKTTTTIPKTTTMTLATTTTSTHNPTTTYNPAPFTLGPLPPLDHPAYLYSSFALNILFFLLFCVVLILKCKKSINRCLRNRRMDVENNAATNPIVRTRTNRNRFHTTDGFSLLSSSSEDFGTHENLPLLNRPRSAFIQSESRTPRLSRTSRIEIPPLPLFRNAASASPTVPSFLNSPVVPSTNSSPNSNDLFDPILNVPPTALHSASSTFDRRSRTTSFKKAKPAPPQRQSSLKSAESTF